MALLLVKKSIWTKALSIWGTPTSLSRIGLEIFSIARFILECYKIVTLNIFNNIRVLTHAKLNPLAWSETRDNSTLRICFSLGLHTIVSALFPGERSRIGAWCPYPFPILGKVPFLRLHCRLCSERENFPDVGLWRKSISLTLIDMYLSCIFPLICITWIRWKFVIKRSREFKHPFQALCNTLKMVI